MTSNIGLYFVIFILAMIPLVFLGAGQDTTRQHAVRKQCRKDVLLDWTDKDALAAEHNDAQVTCDEHHDAREACDVPSSACLAQEACPAPRTQVMPKAAAAVEVIPRNTTVSFAA